MKNICGIGCSRVQISWIQEYMAEASCGELDLQLWQNSLDYLVPGLHGRDESFMYNFFKQLISNSLVRGTGFQNKN